MVELPAVKQKILVYSPYNWVVHAIFEKLVARKLIDSDAQVKIVHCDGIFTACDSEKKCFRCNLVRKRVEEEFQTKSVKISLYADLEKIQQDIYAIDSFSDDELQNYVVDGINLSKSILSSFYSYFRTSTVDFSKPGYRQKYIEFLKSALIAHHSLKNLYSEFKPDKVLVFNGRFFSQQIFLLLAEQLNIPSTVHEVGVLTDTMRIVKTKQIINYESTLRNWEEAENKPLSEAQFIEAFEIIMDWRSAKNRIGRQFIDPATHKDPIDDILDRSKKYKKTILFLTSSEDEIAASEGFDEMFSSQNDWIEQSIKYLEKRSDILGIIRIHPNTLSPRGNVMETLNYIDDLMAKGLPKNMILIRPETKINTYALMKLSNVGVTYGSTAGVEMSSMKKKILVVRKCLFYHLSFIEKIKSRQEYHSKVDDLLDIDFTPSDYAKTLRFILNFAHAHSLDFKFIKPIKERVYFLNFNRYENIKDSYTLNNVTNAVDGNDPVPNVYGLGKESDLKFVNQVTNYDRPVPQNVVYLSTLTADAFYDDSKQYEFYKRLIFRHGSLVKLIFMNDETRLKKDFQDVGGYAGYFSKTYRTYYKYIFIMPFMSFIHRPVRTMFFWFFRRFYTKKRMVKELIQHYNPEYVVDFTNSEFIKRHNRNWRYFGIRDQVC